MPQLLAEALLKTLIAIAMYAVSHELAHLLAAKLLGYHARLTLYTGLPPSPAVVVEDYGLPAMHRALILYSPYVINIILLMLPGIPVVARAVAAATLPNILFESEAVRQRLGYLGLAVGVVASVMLAFTFNAK